MSIAVAGSLSQVRKSCLLVSFIELELYLWTVQLAAAFHPDIDLL